MAEKTSAGLCMQMSVPRNVSNTLVRLHHHEPGQRGKDTASAVHSIVAELLAAPLSTQSTLHVITYELQLAMM